jgi:hypothetical protein
MLPLHPFHLSPTPTSNIQICSSFLGNDGPDREAIGFVWQCIVLLIKAIDLYLVVAKFVEDFRGWKRGREMEGQLELERKRVGPKRRRRRKWKRHYF